MFGIGFFELLVIAVLGLLVFGPEKLPEAIRTFAFAFSKAKRSWQSTRRELEQELGMDEIRREIHNAQVMETLEKNKAVDDSHSAEVPEAPGTYIDSEVAHEPQESDSPDSAESQASQKKTSD